MAISKITTNSITDDAVTNAKVADDAVNTAQIANDAVTTGKLTHSETVLQVVNNHNTSQNSYSGGSSSSGLDVLDSGTITTKALNSQFLIFANITYAFSSTEGTNWDGKDVHWSCLRTYNTGSGASHVFVGNSSALNRNTGNAGTSATRFYTTDVPWGHNDYSEQHQGNYDTHQLSFCFYDQPNQAAGTTVQYRIRGYYQAAMYINRSITSTESGGISNLVVLELGAN
jgi:hypothetical protein|tara:strand:+ start:1025 stop:1708 length:684 start_codon:yes stop_codon:yes gene_type:complete